jgi:AcrR family transcriptional regulator
MQATRDRLLLAAAELMESQGREFSTRALCEAAGVTAPTLYHHFGSKEGIIEAVVGSTRTHYEADDDEADPVRALREGWDRHVLFGLESPTFYALLYGRVRPGKPCTITAPATAHVEHLLDLAARAGLLRVPPADAAARILAANVGVTLMLIAQPEDNRDMALSTSVRDYIFSGVLAHRVDQHEGVPDTRESRATSAIGLDAALDADPGDLTAGELALLRELLTRLSR